jgi:hypothetical protein
MTMKIPFSLSVCAMAVIAVLASGPAKAQLQTQGLTAGSPGPPQPKPTRAECVKKAAEQNLSGSKRKTFVDTCMAGNGTE